STVTSIPPVPLRPRRQVGEFTDATDELVDTGGWRAARESAHGHHHQTELSAWAVAQAATCARERSPNLARIARRYASTERTDRLSRAAMFALVRAAATSPATCHSRRFNGYRVSVASRSGQTSRRA